MSSNGKKRQFFLHSAVEKLQKNANDIDDYVYVGLGRVCRSPSACKDNMECVVVVIHAIRRRISLAKFALVCKDLGKTKARHNVLAPSTG